MALRSGSSRTVRTSTGQRVPIPSGDPTGEGYAQQYAAYAQAATPEQMASVAAPTMPSSYNPRTNPLSSEYVGDVSKGSVAESIRAAAPKPTATGGYTYKGVVYPTSGIMQAVLRKESYERLPSGWVETEGELIKVGERSYKTSISGKEVTPWVLTEEKAKKGIEFSTTWASQKVKKYGGTTVEYYETKPYVGDVSKGSLYYEMQHPTLEIGVPSKPSITESLLFGYGYTQQKAISGAGFVLSKAYEYETYPSKYLGGKSSKFGFTNWTSFGEAFDIGEAKYSRRFGEYYGKAKTSKGITKGGYYIAAGSMFAGETIVGFGGVMAKHPVSTVLSFKAITMLPVGLQLGTFGGLTAYEVYKSDRPVKTLAESAVLLAVFVGGGKVVEKLFYKPKIKGTTVTSETFEKIRAEELSIYDVRAKTKTYIELGRKKKELTFRLGGKATRTLVESSTAIMGKKEVIIKLDTKAGEVWLGVSEKEAPKVLGLLGSGEKISFGEASYFIAGKTGKPLGYGATFDITALTEKGDWAKSIGGGVVSVRRKTVSFLLGEDVSHKFLEVEKPWVSIVSGKVLKEPKVKVWRLTPEAEARLMIKTGKLLYVKEQAWIQKKHGGPLGRAWTLGTGKGKHPDVPAIELRKDLSSSFGRYLRLSKQYISQTISEKEFISWTRVVKGLERWKVYMPTRREVLAHEILHVKNPKFSEKTVRKLHPIYAKAGFEHVKVGRTGELSISGTPSGTYSFWESIGYGRIQKKGEKSFLKLGKHVVVTMLPAAEVPTELGGGVTTVLKTKIGFKTAPSGIKEMVSKFAEKELSILSVVSPSPLLKFKPSYLSNALREERLVVEVPSTKLRTKEFLEVESKVKGVQKTITRLRSEGRLKTDLKTDLVLRNMLKSNLGLDTETQLRIETRLGYELKTESKTRTSTEMSVPFVPPPPVIIIPRLGVDIFIPRGKGGLFRRPKFKPRYTPSVMAGMFNIRGKQPRMITGLETRPLP